MTQKQLEKLDKNCYLKFSMDDNCIQETIEARKLLCSERFDFYAILVYIDQKVKGVKNLNYAIKLYQERTKAMTSRKVSEPGNDEKNSFDDFLLVLDNMIDDFQNGRYDVERTLVPVDKNYVPLDGAHRVSCAAYFNKEINILRFTELEYQFKGYQYLKQELLPTQYSDMMALESLKWHDDLYVFFIWPKAHKTPPDILKNAEELIRFHTDVLYETEYKLSYTAIRNLMIQIYGHMDWLGNIDNDFANVLVKVDEVWANNGKVKLVITHGKSCEHITELKAQIRNMFGIGLSSCHSTDNMRETCLALNALLNPHSRHFLERAKPTTYKNSYKLVESFKKTIKEKQLPLNNFIIDSSMVLSVYGAREAKDLDFYCLPNTDISVFEKDTNIEEHDDTQRSFYEYPIEDYINNPENYFVFNEIKFMSLPNLLKFKQKRFERCKDSKDAADIALIQKYSIRMNFMKSLAVDIKYDILRRKRACYDYVYALIFWRRREILEKIGLYKPLKTLKTLLGR